MRPLVRRQALVLGLILAAGLAGTGLRARDTAPPALPPIAALTERTSWRVVDASEPGLGGIVYRQWQLADSSGRRALLYLGATSRLQSVLLWSAELGYRGQGYVVTGRRDASVPLGDGRLAPVAETRLQHLADRRLLLYVVVGAGSFARQGRDLAVAGSWDLVRGHPGHYYLVRVSVPGGDDAAATAAGDLLAGILPRLVARARAG